MPTSNSTTLRHLAFALAVFGMLGTVTELVLLDHFESRWQWAPVIALATGIAAAVFYAIRRSSSSVRLFRAVMMGLIAVGITGLIQHFLGNRTFELEMRPTMSGMELVWESLTGATPALAPGVLIQLGLLGLLFTFHHPLLSHRGAEPPRPTPESGP